MRPILALVILPACGHGYDYSVHGLDVHQLEGWPSRTEMSAYLESWAGWYQGWSGRTAKPVLTMVGTVSFSEERLAGDVCGRVIPTVLGIQVSLACGDPWYLLGHELGHIAEYVRTGRMDNGHESDIWQAYHDWARGVEQ